MTTSPAQSDTGRVLPPKPARAAIVVGSLTAVLYVLESVDQIFRTDLDANGVIPRTVTGLDGILWSPLLHHGWDHLLTNTLPFVVLAFLAMAGGLAQWALVTATIWLVGGVGVWLVGEANTVTVGASGLVFGWMLFLLVRGLFNRSFRQLLVAGVLLVYWGSMLFGVLPGEPGVSWQGHLFGALGGVLAAWLVAVANRGAARAAPTTPPPTFPTL